MGKKLTTDEFIIKSKLIHGNDVFIYDRVCYINNKVNVILFCKKHGEFKIRPDAHLYQSQGCPRCAKITNYEDFLIKANLIHKNVYEYPQFKWKSSKDVINIICYIHGEFKQIINDHLDGHGCSKCNRKIISKDEFIIKSIIKHNNFYGYKYTNYKDKSNKVIIECPIHGVFEQYPLDHMRGCGCPKCSGRNMTKEEFILKSNIIHNNTYKYDDIIFINKITKVKILCIKHSYFEQTPKKHLSGQGCPICNNSRGELFIMNYLKNKNIKYNTQKLFDECKHIQMLKFDFYLPEYNLCIEYDGEQHFKPFRFEKDNTELMERIKRDEIKNSFCFDNKISLIRFKYTDTFEYIERFLNNFFIVLNS